MNLNSPSKIILTPQWRQIPGGWFWGAVAGMMMAVLCGCDTTTYDMHQLEQPVVINSNPFLNSPSGPAPQLTAVDEYDAEVGFSQMVASAGNTTTTQTTVKNNAQLLAFSKIGGQDNRIIRNLSFDADFKAVNALMAMASHISITVTGEVAEIPRPVAVPITTVTVATNKAVVAVHKVMAATNAMTLTTNTVMVATTTNFASAKPVGGDTNQIHSP
jgi:hypothetical protein